MDQDDKPTERVIPVASGNATSLGRAGYEGYARSTGGKTFDGRDMPSWTDLPPHVVKAWEDAALAILNDAESKRYMKWVGGPGGGGATLAEGEDASVDPSPPVSE